MKVFLYLCVIKKPNFDFSYFIIVCLGTYLRHFLSFKLATMLHILGIIDLHFFAIVVPIIDNTGHLDTVLCTSFLKACKNDQYISCTSCSQIEQVGPYTNVSKIMELNFKTRREPFHINNHKRICVRTLINMVLYWQHI